MLGFTYLKNRSLSELTGLTPSDGNFVVGDGSSWTAESGATARASLGLTIGTNVQAYGAILDDLTTLGAPSTDGEFIVATGAGVFAYESGATARASLGLGTGNSPTFTGLDLSGITNTSIPYISASGFANSPIYVDTVNKVRMTTTTANGNMQWQFERADGASDPDMYVTYWGSSGKNTLALTPGTGNGLHVTTDGYVLACAYADTPFTGNARFAVLSGNFGIGEGSPVTQMEMTGTAPYITLHNSTEENGDGGRESRIIARGEQDGTEESVLGYLEFAHSGSSDDEKGLFRVLLNDGDDAAAPSITGIMIDETGDIYAGAAKISDNSGNLQSANGVASFSGAITNLTVVNGIVTAAS